MLGPDVIIDPDIPGPIYGNPNVPGKDQIGRSGPAYTFRPKPVLKEGPEGPGPGMKGWGGEQGPARASLTPNSNTLFPPNSS